MLRRVFGAVILTGIGAVSGGAQIVPAVASVIPGPGFLQIQSVGPLSIINVGQDTTMQAVDNRVSTFGEFYSSGTSCTGDAGVQVTLGTKLYGPNPNSSWHCTGSTGPQPDVVYTPVAQIGAGNGSAASPYQVVTTVRLTSAVTLTQTVSYVAGQTFVTETNTLRSTGPTVSAHIYNAAQPSPGGYGVANGYYNPATGGVGAWGPVDPATGKVGSCTTSTLSPYIYAVTFEPMTPWNHSVVDQNTIVYNQVAAGKAGNSLSDSVNYSCQRTAMAVEWDVHAAVGAPASVTKNISFYSNFPTLAPGTVTGKATCNALSAPTVTCTPIPVSLNGGLGSSYSFYFPVKCDSGTYGANLQDRICSGLFSGHIGVAGFTMSVKSGGLQIVGPGVYTATLHGTGLFANVLSRFLVSATDNDTTGVDTVHVSILQPLGNSVQYTWTCRYSASCLEILPGA